MAKTILPEINFSKCDRHISILKMNITGTSLQTDETVKQDIS